MALSPGEQEIWERQIADLADPSIEFEPVRLDVEDRVFAPVDIAYAIVASMESGKLSQDDSDRALSFLETILNDTGDIKSVLAELQYEEDESGLKLLLKLPVHGSNDG